MTTTIGTISEVDTFEDLEVFYGGTWERDGDQLTMIDGDESTTMTIRNATENGFELHFEQKITQDFGFGAVYTYDMTGVASFTRK
ncbi:MAG: hypothetical protein ACPGJS_23775 [Flammeovirgaceae bacterium]